MTEKTKAELNKELNRLAKENSLLKKKIEKFFNKKIIEKNEATLKTIFENAGVGIAQLSAGKLNYVNTTLQKMLGYSEKELMELSIKKIIHPEDLEIDAKLSKELADGKRNRYQVEKRYIHKDGRIINGRLTVSLIEGKQKKAKKTIALIEDITEQKQILDTLATEQNLFTTLLDSVPDYIYFKDLNSRFIKVNKACAIKHGFASPELAIGKTDADTFGEEHTREAFRDEQNIIKTGIPIIGKEEKEDWPDGRTTWASTSKMPLYDKGGKICGVFGITRDITKSKLAQEAIKESERIYRSLFEGSADGIFLTSNGTIIDCNSAVLEIFRCSRDYIVGQSPAEFSPEFQPDGRDSLSSANEKIDLAFNGTPQRFYWQHKRPDGGLIDCKITLKAITIEGKKLIQATMRDITEKKLMQERFEESQKIYRILFEGSIDGMFLMTDVFFDCNQAACDLLKCTHADLFGRSPADFSPETQPDGKNSLFSANEKIEAALAGVSQKFYWQFKTKDGFLIDTDVSFNTVTNAGRKLVQAVVRDISVRKKSEKIREALFEISEAAYTASDMTTLFKKIHDAVGTLMIAKNFYIALHDDRTGMISFPYMIDEYDPPYEPKKFGKGLTEYVLTKGESTLINAEVDLELRRTGDVELVGTPTSIWLGVPLKVGGKAIGVIVVQDYENEKAYGEEEMQVLNFVSEQIAQVIERKRNSDAVKKYTEELKQLNTTKDKFFSIIAHDLKNPFITILGFSDLLISDFREITDDEKIYYITEMKKSAEISHHLLQNLLHWSRSQTGHIEFNPQKIDLYDVITSNVELLKPSAERKQIEMLFDIPKSTFVFADEDMLNTIIRNLITNSLKFTNRNGKIEINCTDENNNLRICVLDTGIGISEKVKANLFRLDVTQTTSGTEKEVGTGLGLILCKEFIEKHGGTISVESEVGKGSKFCITIPKLVKE